MTPELTTQYLWPFLRWPISVAYLWWATVWLTVAFYYLSSAKRAWAKLNPNAPHWGLTLFLGAVWRMATGGLVSLFNGTFGTPVPRADHGYPSGMVLQFGIVCSAVCSALFGLTLFGVDRSQYGMPLLCATLSAVMLSTVGGVIHLYPPLHRRAALWRSAMLFTWLGMGTAYVGATLYALYR